MDDVIEVDNAGLWTCSARLADLGHRLGHGLAGAPGLTVSAPEWSAARTLADLESAVHGWLTAIGAGLADTADRVRAAAQEYETVDLRVARRLAETG
ncbi:MAG TPA: hypothetical protein VF174_09305 [Micromonosporaceae bacterium]